MPERAPLPPKKTAADDTGGRGIFVWTGLAVLMFGVAVTLPFVAKDVYHRYHAYRAEKIAAAATVLLKEERWEAASQVLKADFKTYGRDAPVLRALAALFLEGYDDPTMGANLLRQVLAIGKANPTDVRKLAQATLKLGDTPEARRLYETLPDRERSNRDGLELLAGIQRQSGEIDLADKTLRQSLTLDPDDPRSQFRLALLDEAGRFEVSKTVASKAVWNIARRNDSLALEAIAHLCSSSSLTAQQAGELLTLVEQNPRAVSKDRYRVLGAQLRLRPLDSDKVIAAEVQKNKGVASESLFDFLRWLGVQKQYDRIIELVRSHMALNDPDVFLVYVDALSAAERWKELLELVQQPKIPVSDPMRNFISATCLCYLKPDLDQAGKQMEKVYALAGPTDQLAILRTAALAESKGLDEIAITGYARMAEARPNLRVGLLEKVLELQSRGKDVTAMLATLRQLSNLRPINHSYIDRLNYLRLLVGDEIELACESVMGFGEGGAGISESAAVPQSLLHALAAMRMGDHQRMAEAVKIFEPSMRLPAGQRAVMAGIVAASGNDVGAFRMSETIPYALLLPDEIVFLQRALR